ncbi:MAG: hypothetical protein AVDCRST_MAG29-805, partial [uncultured Nocardioidaceae bacterium]
CPASRTCDMLRVGVWRGVGSRRPTIASTGAGRAGCRSAAGRL